MNDKILKNINNIITEARSHSNLNPKITLFENLYQFRNNKDYFVTFNSIAKVGINPNSKWRSISGVYAYPLDFILHQLSCYYNFIFDSDTIYDPVFGHDQDLVHVLKKQNVPNMEFVYITDLSSSYVNYDRDRQILINYFNNVMVNILKDKEIINKEKENMIYFINYTDAGGIETGRRIERLDKSFFLIIDMVRFLANLYIKYLNYNELKFGTIMNSIITKQLHYCGFSDCEYTGSTLHPDIPYESLFLVPQAYKVIETYPNKNYKNLVLNNYNELQTKLFDMFKNINHDYNIFDQDRIYNYNSDEDEDDDGFTIAYEDEDEDSYDV